jgi:hypothetical protein
MVRPRMRVRNTLPSCMAAVTIAACSSTDTTPNTLDFHLGAVVSAGPADLTGTNMTVNFDLQFSDLQGNPLPSDPSDSVAITAAGLTRRIPGDAALGVYNGDFSDIPDGSDVTITWYHAGSAPQVVASGSLPRIFAWIDPPDSIEIRAGNAARFTWTHPGTPATDVKLQAMGCTSDTRKPPAIDFGPDDGDQTVTLPREWNPPQVPENFCGWDWFLRRYAAWTVGPTLRGAATVTVYTEARRFIYLFTATQ